MKKRVEKVEKAFKQLEKLKLPKELQKSAFEFILFGESRHAEQLVGNETKKHQSSAKNPFAEEINKSTEQHPLRLFISEKNPAKKAVEEIPCLVYWARDNDGKNEVNEDDVWELYKISGRKPPKTLAQSLRDLSSKKRSWRRLESIRGKVGYVKLTRAGEIFVEHDVGNNIKNN